MRAIDAFRSHSGQRQGLLTLVAAALMAAALVGDTAQAQILRLNRTGFVQTFDEEFNGPLDEKRWTPAHQSATSVENRSIPTNHELELYVDPLFQGRSNKPLGLAPVLIENGILKIAATPTPPSQKDALWGYPYVSGEITTENSFSQEYGYFEVRAKLPKGKGFWPAFWLLAKAGGWPPEIDIMEMLGRKPTALYTSVHTKAPSGQSIQIKEVQTPDLSADFHTYGALWDKDRVRFYVDDTEVFAASTPPDLHQPCYMILNLAIGGEWAQAPDQSTRFPGVLQVDWVRVFQLKN